MVLAQSLGEYGASGGVMAQLVSAIESGADWMQLSLREDHAIWIGAGICLVVGLWLFRRG